MNIKISKRGFTIDELKYIAIIAMLVNHLAVVFLDHTSILFILMDTIGRITGPIMFFSAVEGYHHTKNLKKYFLRLLIFAMISYFPFIYVFENRFNPLRLNVIFTILFGLLSIHAKRSINNPILKVIVIFFFFIISIPADYGLSGMIMIFMFDLYYEHRKYQLWGYLTVVFLYMGVLHFFIGPFFYYFYRNIFDFTESLHNISSLGYLIPAFLIHHYNGKHKKSSIFSRWIFYIFYPGHLILIWMIRDAIRQRYF